MAARVEALLWTSSMHVVTFHTDFEDEAHDGLTDS